VRHVDVVLDVLELRLPQGLAEERVLAAVGPVLDDAVRVVVGESRQ